MSINNPLIKAMAKVVDKYPEFDILSVVDYDKWFIFDIKPSNLKADAVYIMPLVGVDKQDSSMIGFNPMYHDYETYKLAVKENKIDLSEMNKYRRS